MNELDPHTLKRCKRGDPQALGTLYDCYRQPVYYMARRMVGEQQAEDLCQEIFIAIFRSVRRFKGKSKFSTWVMAVATKVCLMHLRKQRPRNARTISLDTMEYEPVMTLSPSQQVADKEFWERLSAAIDALPERQRAAVTLRSFEEMSYREIAKAMGTGIEDVRAMLFRARRKLIEMVRKE